MVQSGEIPLTPQVYEDLAQSYALLIVHDEFPMASLPPYPVGLKARVEYLVAKYNADNK